MQRLVDKFGRLPRLRAVSGLVHHINGTNDGHSSIDESERRCGNYFISARHQSDDNANEQERGDLSDVNASRCEEPIYVEVMFEEGPNTKCPIRRAASAIQRYDRARTS